MDPFGCKIERNSDWFDARTKTFNPVVNAKKAALLEYKQNPSKKTLSNYRKARNLAKATSRHCANNYWSTISKSIQRASDCGNVATMSEGIKKAFGPQISKSAPIRSSSGETLKDRGKQLERWAEHFQKLYSEDFKISDQVS